jgi:hypothetical protein
VLNCEDQEQTTRSVHVVDGALAFWMQTTGAPLLAVSGCSSPRVWTLAQDSRSAYGLLYLAAVWAGWHEQEPRQGTIDSGPSLVRHCHRVAWYRSPGNLARLVTRSIGECRMSL